MSGSASAPNGDRSDTPDAGMDGTAGRRAFIDIHCHTRASFDSLADPFASARAAAKRGLTHLAITDHDRVDAAVEVAAAPPPGLVVIVGEEVKTADGDMVALFLRNRIEPGLSALETIAAVREQGGLIGVPHPYDRFRGFGGPHADLEAIADKIDWVEAYNARVVGGTANEKAALFARDHGLPGVAASDSHTVLEVGVAYNSVGGDPSTPEGLLASLRDLDLVTGRASFYVRGWTPIAKIVQRLRGRGRAAARRS